MFVTFVCFLFDLTEFRSPFLFQSVSLWSHVLITAVVHVRRLHPFIWQLQLYYVLSGHMNTCWHWDISSRTYRNIQTDLTVSSYNMDDFNNLQQFLYLFRLFFAKSFQDFRFVMLLFIHLHNACDKMFYTGALICRMKSFRCYFVLISIQFTSVYLYSS